MNSDAVWGQVLDIQADPYRIAKEWKSAHRGKVLAHLLPDVPEEIIHASGSLPLPILANEKKTSLADSRLPPFVCSSVKGPLEMALQGELDFVDGMVIPYVCDTTRAFSQIWETNFPKLFNHTVLLPKKTTGVSLKRFLYQEFLRFKEKLEAFSGREITDSDLRRSVRIYNSNREIIREIFGLRKQGQVHLTYADFLTLVKASMTIPKEQSNALLKESLQYLRKQSEPVHGRNSAKIYLFGSVCEAPSILKHFDHLGLQVVEDNLYNGTRYFSQDVDETLEPIEGLIERQLAKDPLSCFYYPNDQWSRHLKRSIETNQIKGFVYLTLKYCDPAEFDYPVIKEFLGKFGVPVLFLETDLSSVAEAQLRTRLEAFAEILRDQE